MNNLDTVSAKIAILGLGYVGLPLAVEFSKVYHTIGFDISKSRVKELKSGIDSTLEVSSEELELSSNLKYTNDLKEIEECNIYIITVPTPIDEDKKPDLKPLKSASISAGRVINSGDIVIYESTVFPGATEEICVPILEKISGLKFNQDFFCGYSPERINPGDKEHRLTSIKKVTSGSTLEIANIVDKLYSSIITAGTHKAPSIKVAEAAKVIENTQRDVNIALINELSMIFNNLGIDTEAILEAAGTKWNFLPFRPGLVGGHCIGVDPYYLTYKAIESGFEPKMILAGRRVNDSMSSYIVNQVSKLMNDKGINLISSDILIMGLSFKENCPDLRNTKVMDIIHELNSLNCNVHVYDPWVDKSEALEMYGLDLIDEPTASKYDSVLITVAHNQFKDMTAKKIKSFAKDNHVIYDVKFLLDPSESDGRL
jgi:UDP-N-acetyl-D-glucosamine/UDP-N-acetyl-D-galactosamine dehydrogenase